MARPMSAKFLERLEQVAKGEVSTMGVNDSDLRALRIYFNNRRHQPRKERDENMAKLGDVGPLRLYLNTEANYLELLKKRCYIKPGEWRNTEFTRAFGIRQRNIMDNFGALYLAGFRDEQGDQSLAYECNRWPHHEAMFVVPVYEMRNRAGTDSFRFIIRPWQQGGDSITIL